MKEEYILSFSSTNHSILAENLTLTAGLQVRIMPLPGAIRAGCGLCLRLNPEELSAGLTALQEGGVPVEGVHLATQVEGKKVYLPQENN